MATAGEGDQRGQPNSATSACSAVAPTTRSPSSESPSTLPADWCAPSQSAGRPAAVPYGARAGRRQFRDGRRNPVNRPALDDRREWWWWPPCCARSCVAGRHACWCLAVAAMIAILAFAARAQIDAIPRDSPSELCHGAVRWFGMELTASEDFCAAWLDVTSVDIDSSARLPVDGEPGPPASGWSAAGSAAAAGRLRAGSGRAGWRLRPGRSARFRRRGAPPAPAPPGVWPACLGRVGRRAGTRRVARESAGDLRTCAAAASAAPPARRRPATTTTAATMKIRSTFSPDPGDLAEEVSGERHHASPRGTRRSPNRPMYTASFIRATPAITVATVRPPARTGRSSQ